MKSSLLVLLSSLLGASFASLQKPLGFESQLATHDSFTTFQSSVSSEHKIRIKKQNDTICNAGSAQWTGWLDVGPRHFFFWFFESRGDPKRDPLILWLTGGPGGSSMLGLFQELGPCLIGDHGNGTKYNKHSWTEAGSMLFVDQPADVGFSYVDKETPVADNSFEAATDMHMFLQMFVSQVFPHFEKLPFHITGESYAGHYVPTLGAQIVRQNALYPARPLVPLRSIFVGNAYVSPLDTTFGYWETLCTTNPGVKKPVLNETRCDIMASNMPRCLDVAKTCYDRPDPAICIAAGSVCWEGVVKYYDAESYKGGRNRFDITAPCEIDDFCYIETEWLQDYLNSTTVWDALEVPPQVKEYKVSSDRVAMAFTATDDIGISTQLEVQYLLNNEVDALFYNGNLDLACNTAGTIRWMNNMPWKGQTEFASKSLVPWKTSSDIASAKRAGSEKSVSVRMREDSKKRTTLALVTVDDSGHMVPYDQPEVALYMVKRWLKQVSSA